MKNIDKLECVYLCAPIPRNSAVLTVIGTVFDKIYFPNVYLPKGGYDEEALEAEIRRITEVYDGNIPNETLILLGILRFIKYAHILDGLCEFTGSKNHFSSSKGTDELVLKMYEELHGSITDNFIPHFDTGHAKGLPGGDEDVHYPGSFHYPAGAIIFANEKGIPLLNDLPGLPIPGSGGVGAKNDATILSSLLAIECVNLILPELPLLSPNDIVEFRSENASLLGPFRRLMLQYAKEINLRLNNCSDADLLSEVKFFVESQVAPQLHELQENLKAPARSWLRRGGEALIYSSLGGAYMSAKGPSLGAALAAIIVPIIGELSAADEKRKIKRSGLYYPP